MEKEGKWEEIEYIENIKCSVITKVNGEDRNKSYRFDC